MIARLALRNLAYRPGRSVLLLAGFGLGVGVMIVLLSIGDAMVAQARDEKLVGGGSITVLPEGLDAEVMKTGGVGGLFFSIHNARFIHLQLLGSPRLAGVVRAVAPQVEDKLLYLRRPRGAEHAVRATGEHPGATRLVGGLPPISAGVWEDDDHDRRWRAPSPVELRHDIDHFHLPPAHARGDESWQEWHYFNVLSADRRRWAFLSFIVSGAVPDGRWVGQVLLTLHEAGRREHRFALTEPSEHVRFSTHDANVGIGGASVRVLEDGRYAISARSLEGEGAMLADVELTISPAPRAYFPGASIGAGDFVSGYAVAGLRASASGSICVRDRRAPRAYATCERYGEAQAYHDHNWGVWRGVTWEWGSARAGEYSILYGRVHPPDSLAADTPLFLFLTDSLGFRGLFRPSRIAYEDGGSLRVDGRTVRVPSRAVLADVRGDDTLTVELLVEDATVTDTRRSLVERGDSGAERQLATPYFIQMKGTLSVSGRLAGRRVVGEGSGFFETYR